MLTSYRARLSHLLADYRHAQRQVVEERAALVGAKARYRDVKEAQKLAQEVAERLQASAHAQIAGVVTRCLQAVFGPDSYELKISFVQRRNRTEAEICFVKDGKEIDPLKASGGGVVDVASFGLRLACLLLIRPARRRLLVMDEPMKWVSQDHIPAVRSLLVALAQEFGVQLVLVTHLAGLRCGKVIEIGS